MGSPNRTAIVICSHRFNESLESCLEGFLAMAKEPEDLFFVNNGAAERLADWTDRRFPGITIIRLTKNRLFCGGYNVGVRLAMDRGYDFILMSNADTEVVNAQFLGELLKTAERWPRGAFFGPLVFLRQAGMVQNTCLRFPRVFRNSWQWLPWRLARGLMERQSHKEMVVEFLNGVCILCRVNALKEIGLMDETMGGYMEDADWAWRARKRGWLSVFNPVPSIVHHEAELGYEPYSLKTFLLKRNTVYWFLKNHRPKSAWYYAQASMMIDRIRMAKAYRPVERKKHRYFLRKCSRAYRGLLNGEALGNWFGPPLGTWEEENVA
jgi:GT2 family glycosyltransferase